MTRDTQKSEIHETTEDASTSPAHRPQPQQHQFQPSTDAQEEPPDGDSDRQLRQSTDESDFGGTLDLNG